MVVVDAMLDGKLGRKEKERERKVWGGVEESLGWIVKREGQ